MAVEGFSPIVMTFENGPPIEAPVAIRITGVEKNAEAAVEWYRRAADKGDVKAMRYLGLNYEHGIGVEKNVETAVEWFGRAAVLGNLDAMVNMGVACVTWFIAGRTMGSRSSPANHSLRRPGSTCC